MSPAERVSDRTGMKSACRTSLASSTPKAAVPTPAMSATVAVTQALV